MNNFTKLLLAGGLALLGSRAAQAQVLYDNFENTRIVSYPLVQGTLTQNTPNPGNTTAGSTSINTSSTCATYVRSSDAYAVILVKPNNAKMADVTPYTSGTKKMTIKFRSPAVGLTVQAVLQDGTKNTSSYPNGKYLGDFFATTTKAGDWETLTFTFTAAGGGNYDTSLTATDVNQLVFLVSPNTTAPSTSYFDDIMGPELVSTATTTVVTDQLLDNHEGTRAVKYKRNLTGGAIRVDTLNPAKNTVNQSNNVLRYSRSTGQYDGLFMGTVGAPMADVTPFLTNAKQMTMKVYSPAVGTKYQITLQDSTSAHANGYPTGRHSEYLATSTVANAWETLVFSFSQRPDANLPSTGLNEFVLLINSGTTQGVKVYLDDFYGPHLTNYLSARQASTVANLGSPFPNPVATGLARLPFALKQPATVSLTVFDALGRRVAQPVEAQAYPAGEHAADLNTARLAPGIYTCRLLVDGAVLTSALSVQ